MDDTQIFGIAVTAALLAGGLLWALPSLRRVFLIAIVLGIAGAYRVGTATGGMYPYEILVIVCGFWMLTQGAAPWGRPSAYTQRIMRFLAVLAVWWVVGALVNVFVVKPDLGLLASMGLSTDGLQVKFMGHLFGTLLVTGIAFWAGGTLFNPETDTKRVMSAILCGTTLLSLATLFEWVKEAGGGISRYNFLPPTDLGPGDTSRMALIGAVCCLILLLSRKPAHKALLAALLLVHLSAIMTIETRQGYVAAFLHFAVLVPLCARIHFNWRQRLSALAVAPFAVGVVLAGFAVLLTTTGFDKSFLSLRDSSFEDRSNKAALFDSTLEIFRQHPVIGVGRGQFSIYADVPMVISGQAVYVATPHNGLAELLSETGLIGAILAYAASLLLIWRLWRVYRGPHSPLTRSLAGVIAFMVGYTVVVSLYQSHAMFPTPIQRDGIRTAFVYWFLAGFATGARRPEIWRRVGAAGMLIQLRPGVRQPQGVGACR